MSTTTMPEQTTGVTTFRGRSLEELLPQIREQLGPDAVVLRQRDGLIGGIGGFFQQRFVEVDARTGHARVDTYDEEPEPFAQLLAAAEAETAEPEGGPRTRPQMPGSDSLSSPEPTSLDAEPAAPAPSLTTELTATGMSHQFATKLVADAEAHELPFTQGDMRTAVRRALARRLPTALPHRAGGLAVAFAGPGSTACADALASAYQRAGRDARAIASLDKARALLERGSPDAVIAVDLPPVATERAEVDALAERLGRLTLDETIAVMPAALDLPTARALLDRLQPLSPTALALSFDAEDPDLGAAIELACTSRLPIAYVHDDGILPADPARLAERVLR
jgi:Meckel syndrome type 1 protein